MGQRQIIDKLRTELESLDSGRIYLEEKDVVYLLVEARKMIKHEKSEKVFPAIKFYADWAVHIQKDHVPPPIDKIIRSRGAELNEFVNMEYLRQEMSRFFKRYGLPRSLAEGSGWRLFWKQLINVLSEQPLILKTAITKFTFRTTEGRGDIAYDCEA